MSAPTRLAAHPALETAALLWPGATAGRARGRGPASPATRDLLVLPTWDRPRLLVPTGVPGAAAMLGRHSTSTAQRGLRALLATGVRTGVLARLPASRLRLQADGPVLAGVDEHLSELLGADLRVGVLLGPLRANGKPVLQAFDPQGRTVAFVKVAHSPFTAGLVAHEAAALAAVGDAAPGRLEVPRVLHHGPWHDVELLVLSPLASSQQQRAVEPAPTGIMATVAGQRPVPPGAARRTAARRRDRVDALGGDRRALALHAALGRLADDPAAAELRHGAWHGDWSPWNMGRWQSRLQVWDWERYETEAPLGYDALHYAVQRLRDDRRAAADAAGELLARAPALLHDFGVAPRQATATLQCYLVDITTRYLGDGGSAPPPRLVARAAWTTAVLEHTMGTP